VGTVEAKIRQAKRLGLSKPQSLTCQAHQGAGARTRRRRRRRIICLPTRQGGPSNKRTDGRSQHKGHNVPFAHGFCRKPPNEIRKNIAGMVDKWKNRYYNMKGLSQKVDQYLQQGPDLERLRGIVECGILGQFGMRSSKPFTRPRASRI
jgi:hypothetical protein